MDTVGEVLKGLIHRRGWEGQFLKERAVALWPQVVGSPLDRQSRALALRAGRLFVGVAHSLWAQQLSLFSAELLARYERLLGPDVVKGFHFQLGRRWVDADPGREGHEEGEPYPLPRHLPPIPEGMREASLLAAAGGEGGEGGGDAVPGMEVPKVRERWLGFERAACRRAAWRRLRWPPCSACGVAHGGTGPLCVICRTSREEGRR